jgi:hypothetical protein
LLASRSRLPSAQLLAAVRRGRRRRLAAVLLLGGLTLAAACAAQQQGVQPAIRPEQSAPAIAQDTLGSAAPATTASPDASITNSPSPSGTPRATGSSVTGTPSAAQAVSQAGPLEHVDAIALGGDTPVRSEPSMAQGRTVASLADHQPIVILREVRGQRWVVGDQTWPMAIQDWSNLWYQIDGGYVYAGFVYIPRPGELDALADTSGERWIDIDLNTQTARAVIGDRVVHTALATTGKPGYATPAGEFRLEPWGRKFDETMTSAQAGIKDPREQYDVHNVLYTQYFDSQGDALHLNYWQPESAFGNWRTSHGCVGLELHDAQFFWLFTQAGTRVNIHPLPPTPTPTATLTPTASVTVATSTAFPGATTTRTADPTASPTATMAVASQTAGPEGTSVLAPPATFGAAVTPSPAATATQPGARTGPSASVPATP